MKRNTQAFVVLNEQHNESQRPTVCLDSLSQLFLWLPNLVSLASNWQARHHHLVRSTHLSRSSFTPVNLFLITRSTPLLAHHSSRYSQTARSPQQSLKFIFHTGEKKHSSFRCTKRKALSTCLIYLARVRHTAWRKSTWLGLLIAFGTTEATSLVFHRRLWHNMDCVRSTLSSFDSNEAASSHSLFDRLILPLVCRFSNQSHHQLLLHCTSRLSFSPEKIYCPRQDPFPALRSSHSIPHFGIVIYLSGSSTRRSQKDLRWRVAAA